MKTIERKEFVISLKKKGFLWKIDKLDEKRFKLPELAQKCEVVKEVNLKSATFPLKF